MVNKPLTQNVQDYLKHIYDLTESGQPASTTDLAQRLGVAPASVTGMVQRLAALQPPLVDYRKHQGVTLTQAGQQAALEVIRHHRLLETYLVTALGYSWDAVHDEACNLEHVISEQFEAQIDTALGNPQRDPHGEPIPDSDLVMPHDPSLPLSDLLPGQSARIQRVGAADPGLLRHLDDLNLRPGTELEVLAYSPFDQNLTISIARPGSPAHVLGLPVTSQVFVELL